MAFDAITRCSGLTSQYNPLTMQPGALAKANDCVINRENVIEPRRGYANYGEVTNTVSSFLTYQNKVLVNHDDKVAYDNGSGTFSDYTGSYSPPSGDKMRFVEAYSNLYVTTDAGVYVFTDTSGTAARLAGSPRALDPALALTGASGFLANGSQVAYRIVILRVDANGNNIYGYPSTRVIVSNASGGTRDVALTIILPAEILSTDIVQIYRTASIAGTATQDNAGDSMKLVYQASPTSGEVSALSMSVTDSLIDDLRDVNAELYTNDSQQGIAQANDRPPLCRDLALYKSQYMIYANCETKQRLFFDLVTTTGLTGNTITLAGTTYNFGASEITSGGGAPQAKVYATGVVSSDIDMTAKSLVAVINRYASNTSVYAYYLSGPSDLPGQIMIEERGVGAAAFTVQASNTTISASFFPNPPVSPATNTGSTSSNDSRPNYIFYSKTQEPEAVPALNYIPIGSANEEILRIAPLRDSLIIVKERSVWRLTGESPSSFVATPVDTTTYCRSASSVAVLANQVFLLSNQGVVAVSESGVQVVSREIEPNIIPLIGISNISSYAAAVAYESDRSYLLSVPQTAADTEATQTYVYNIFTRTWVRWTYAFVSAIVGTGDDKMYFSNPNDTTVHKERKDFSVTDYADPSTAITITAISGADVTFTISGVTPAEGWVIEQGTTGLAIESLFVGAGFYTATLSDDPPASWTTGAATIYPPVGMEWEWHAWFGGKPGEGLLKQVRQVALLSDNILGNNSATRIVATFRSNLDEATDDVPIAINSGSWGTGPWGSFPWGGAGDPYGYPTYVPRNKQICRLLNVGGRHEVAREKLVVVGLAFAFESFGENINR